jgi:hypothetical protein
VDSESGLDTRLLDTPGWAGGDFVGWQLGTGWMTVGPHDQVQSRNPYPGRVIWNLETPDVRGESERLKAAGATVVQEPYRPGEAPERWIAAFADPDFAACAGPVWSGGVQ